MRRADYFFENLYIVKVPSAAGDKDIEDLFQPAVLLTKLNNKTFYKKNTGLDQDIHYGKAYFAEYVVTPNKREIDFSDFEPLLNTINDIITNYNPNVLD